MLHLSEKVYLQQEGKLKRKWDEARTPYERLKQSGGALSAERQEGLEHLYKQTNPRQLRQEIYRRLSQLWEWQQSAKAQSAA